MNTAGDTLTGTLNYRMLESQTTSNYDTAGDSSGFSVFYGTSSATNKPSGTDHAVATFSYSDAWQTQLAMDWRTNSAYLRTQENGTWKSWNKFFTDGYHPNADKWTTARTLSLSGDASGSVSWDGSANAALSVTVADDSHNHVWGNIDGASVGSLSGPRFTTASGYIEFGPANTTWAHIYTDRPNFYFNRELYVNSNRVYNTAYHPEADKWTTARTLSLSGDATGSVSWDGSANATLSVTVADDSHSHSNYTPIDHFRHTGHGYYTSTTTSALLTEALGDDAFDSKLTAHKTGWSYSGNGDLTDAGRLTELAGTSWLWWTDDSTDNVQGNVTALAIAPNTGGSAGKVFIYNDQGSSYSPGWREVWTSASDGSGSGLDADLLDGVQGSSYLRSDASDTHTGTLSLDIVQVGNELRLPNNTSLTDVTLTGTSDQDTGFNWSGSNAVNYVSGGVLKYNLNNVWHSGNDGSSSGLDADLLDGVQGSSYLRSDANDTASGRVDFSAGITSQTLDIGVTGDRTIQALSSDANFGSYGDLHLQHYGGNLHMLHGGGTAYIDDNIVWHAGNDGASSGLDADLLDGFNSSQSESANTVAVRSSAGYLFSSYFNGSGTFSTTGITSGMARFTGTNGTDTYGRSYTAAAARTLLNVEDGATADQTASEILTAIKTVDGSGSGLDADLLDGVQGSSYLRSDATDTFTDLSGTSLTLGSGVTLQESTDRADLLQITSSTGTWGGLQIRNSSNEGRWSFMTDGSAAGFYDDENGEWVVQMSENGGVTLYANGTANFTTGTTYMEMARHLDMNNYDIYGVDQIFHHGDTNTYMQFHAADQWRVVTGGAERLEVNNSQITSTEPIHAPSFHGKIVTSGSFDFDSSSAINSADYVDMLKGDVWQQEAAVHTDNERAGLFITDASPVFGTAGGVVLASRNTSTDTYSNGYLSFSNGGGALGHSGTFTFYNSPGGTTAPSTTTMSISTAGTVTAPAFVGDGSALTGLNISTPLTALSTGTDATGSDLIPVYDVSAGTWEKQTITNAALQGPAGVNAAPTGGESVAYGLPESTDTTPETAGQIYIRNAANTGRITSGFWVLHSQTTPSYIRMAYSGTGESANLRKDSLIRLGQSNGQISYVYNQDNWATFNITGYTDYSTYIEFTVGAPFAYAGGFFTSASPRLIWTSPGAYTTTYGAVGTYIFGRRAGSTADQGQFVAGSTYAGSTLYPAGISTNAATTVLSWPTSASTMYTGDTSSAALSGTWRAMGTSHPTERENPVTLFVRIS